MGRLKRTKQGFDKLTDPWKISGERFDRLDSFKETEDSKLRNMFGFNTKVSFGLIICRVNTVSNRPEAVMVRARYTYAFSEFIHGHYAFADKHLLKSLFSNMTIDERLDVYSLNFHQMWFRIWLVTDRYDLYQTKFNKFQNAWIKNDEGRLLRQYIQQARGYRSIHWGFPKGKRQHPRESNLSCAIREFQEETNIPERSYHILPEFRRRESYEHMGVRYVNIYYVGIQKNEFPDPNKNLSLERLEQVAEIAEIRWMDIEQIRGIEGPAGMSLENTAKPVFKYIKGYLKYGYNPSLQNITLTCRAIEKICGAGGEEENDNIRDSFA